MTAYQEFINTASVKPGKIAWLWELEVNERIDNFLDFTRTFLEKKGFKYTGCKKDEYGQHKAVFNNKFMFNGAIQEGNKIAIRLQQI